MPVNNSLPQNMSELKNKIPYFTQTVSAEAAGTMGTFEMGGQLQDFSYQLSASISANNIQMQGTVDGTNWITLRLVSGTGVSIGNVSNVYTGVRGFVDTYSSGTPRIDIIGKLKDAIL